MITKKVTRQLTLTVEFQGRVRLEDIEASANGRGQPERVGAEGRLVVAGHGIGCLVATHHVLQR